MKNRILLILLFVATLSYGQQRTFNWGAYFDGILSATNLSGTNTGDQDISAIGTNTTAIGLNTAKVSFDSTSSTRLANTSGTNTGDQTLTGLNYEPTKGADDNFVTDAEKIVIGNTSNTNTGDQTIPVTAVDFDPVGTDNSNNNAVNTLYSGLVSNATHTSEVTGGTALTIASGVVDSDNIVDTTIDEIDLDASVNASLDLADSAIQTVATVVETTATIAMGTRVMYNDQTLDAATITLSDCQAGEILTVYINRSAVPTLAGTGLTFNLLPNTTTFVAGNPMAIAFQVSYDGTTVDYFYYER